MSTFQITILDRTSKTDLLNFWVLPSGVKIYAVFKSQDKYSVYTKK